MHKEGNEFIDIHIFHLVYTQLIHYLSLIPFKRHIHSPNLIDSMHLTVMCISFIMNIFPFSDENLGSGILNPSHLKKKRIFPPYMTNGNFPALK